MNLREFYQNFEHGCKKIAILIGNINVSTFFIINVILIFAWIYFSGSNCDEANVGYFKRYID